MSIITAIISSSLSRADDDKDACNLLPGRVSFYWSPCHETKHKICSREINLTSGEIKRRWDTGRQSVVSFSHPLPHPKARPGGKTRRLECDIHILDRVPPSTHAEPTRQRCEQGLWPWRAGKRDIYPELAANPALPCWHCTSMCVWAVNC